MQRRQTLRGSLVSRNNFKQLRTTADLKLAFHLLATRFNLVQDHQKKELETTTLLMQELIEAGADLHALDHKGNTALHEAFESRMSSWDVSRMLNAPVTTMINLGASIRALNHQGRTILHGAAATEEYDLQNMSHDPGSSRIDFCLQQHLGLDINARDHEGFTPLHLAVAKSDISVWKLIKRGADVQARTLRGLTALHIAAKAGACNIVDILVQYHEANSFSLDCQDLKGRTPLHEAARSGRPESVSILLAAGASYTIPDKRGRTALHAAAEFEDVPMARVTQHAEDSEDPLAQDSFSQRTYRVSPTSPLEKMEIITQAGRNSKSIREVVKLLLNVGIDAGQLDNNEHTANDVAIMLGNAAVVEELAESMASLYSAKETTPPSSTLQPLDPIGEMLLRSPSRNIRGIIEDLNFADSSAQLLERIISYGDNRLLEAVVPAKISPDLLVQLDGWSPSLHLIAKCGLTSMMKTLLPFVKDMQAIKPPLLHIALRRSLWNIDMINVLIQHGVDVNARYLDPKPGYHNHYNTRKEEYCAVHVLATGECSWYPRALQQLLRAGADSEILNDSGETALQIALASRSVFSSPHSFCGDQTLDVLLEHGANVNLVASKTRLTPLNTALECHGGPEIVRKLLDHGADGSLGPKPALASAIDSQDPACLKLLLEAGADPNQVYMSNVTKPGEPGPQIETPLINAACNAERKQHDPKAAIASMEIITILLEHGADPNQSLNDGNTSVLHEIAALNGIIKPMLIDGVDLESRDENGCTPLIRACDLPEHYGRYGRYGRTISEAHAAYDLIEAGANIHAVDNTGSTALHYAIKSDLPETFKKLLEKGASPNIKDGTGTTPIFYAFDSWRFEDIVSLLDAGADPLQTTPDGKTLLHYLASKLIRHNATVVVERPGSPVSSIGSIALDDTDYLAEYTKLFTRCIEAGCDPEARDNNGRTPIFEYVGFVKDYDVMGTDYPPDEKEIRKVLDKHDVHVVNNDGDTLLHVVAGRDEDAYHLDDGLVIFKILVEMGLDPKRENKSGATPVDVAAACGNQEILKLFARDE